jgi:hypothetical protein
VADTKVGRGEGQALKILKGNEPGKPVKAYRATGMQIIRQHWKDEDARYIRMTSSRPLWHKCLRLNPSFYHSKTTRVVVRPANLSLVQRSRKRDTQLIGKEACLTHFLVFLEPREKATLLWLCILLSSQIHCRSFLGDRWLDL